MKKDTIVQFVGFITNLNLDEFAPKWEAYAKKVMNKNLEPVLQQVVAETKNKFRYISRHELSDKDFHFTFMNERLPEHFPEHNVKIVQTGGYIPLQQQKKKPEEEDNVQVIAFISHNETDLDFYRSLPSYRYLDIHQAYYESCLYGYVMEFHIPETEADELLLQLKQRPGVETGVYRECLVPHI